MGGGPTPRHATSGGLGHASGAVHPATGCGDGLEAGCSEEFGTAFIPGIGHYEEAILLVEGGEGVGFLGE